MTTAVSKMFESTGGVMPKELVPQQRMGNEDELAGTVLYLTSKVYTSITRIEDLLTEIQAGGFCNGSLIVIDGGFLQNHSGP
jgi:hypothetical protein